MFVRKVSILAAAAALLGVTAACNDPVYDQAKPLSADFGRSYYNNMAVHTIDPHPEHPGEPSALDGDRGLGAMERYRGGTVITPTPESVGEL
jgi:hypothetical protein